MNDMTTNLATYSVVLTYSAMAVYVIAFISFALDMAKRSGEVTAAAAAGAGADDTAGSAAASARGAKTVATVRGGTVVLEQVATPPSGGSAGAPGDPDLPRRIGGACERPVPATAASAAASDTGAGARLEPVR